jgi:hypothetical protein
MRHRGACRLGPLAERRVPVEPLGVQPDASGDGVGKREGYLGRAGHGGWESTANLRPAERRKFFADSSQGRSTAIGPAALVRVFADRAVDNRLPRMVTSRRHRACRRYCIISSGGIGPHKFAASGVFGQVFGLCG